jgi:hypothetical protein
MLYNNIDKVENFVFLVQEVKKIIADHGEGLDQLVCQTLEGDAGNWSKGSGRVSELEIQDETMYKHIQPALQGTNIEKLIKHYGAFRTRIMRLKPKTCYSNHFDPSPRIHIPIITNYNCFMIWPSRENLTCVNLLPGQLYWTDTTKPHTFANCDESLERIHIVMSVSQ